MSGYTTTPNLSLKMPTGGGDDDSWGTHLNENALLLDSAVMTPTRADASYLALSGGELTGKLTINNGGLNVRNLPTSSAGLSPGDIYINGGFLCIVP